MSTRGHERALWSILIALGCSAACTTFDRTALDQLACRAQTDCDSGLDCVDGFCVSTSDVVADASGTDLRLDAGPPDAGPRPDGAVEPDADIEFPDAPRLDGQADVGPDGDAPPDGMIDLTPGAPTTAPTPIRPLSGSKTGSVHAGRAATQPWFVWSPVAGASSYELHLEGNCLPTQIATCTPNGPQSETTTATEFQWPTPLSVAMAEPVGTRYVWHVRACNDQGCGPWSSARYVDVGRLWSDRDGDGYGDLYVGDEDTACGSGAALCYRAHTFFGDSTLSLTREVGPMRNTTASSAGFALANAGDVDADGYGDHVFGHQGTAFDSGDVLVITGESFDFLYPSGGVGDRQGLGVAPAYDVDHDGHADVLTAAGALPSDGADQMGLQVFRGGPVNEPFPGQWDMLLGLSASGEAVAVDSGDIDGDGAVDLVAGTESSGSVFIFASSTGDPWSSAPIVVAGGSGHGRDLVLGRFSSADWIHDIAVGAPGVANGSGEVVLYLHSGDLNAPTALTISAPAGGAFGTALARGDVDGDGFDDIAVGAPSEGVGGAVHVIRGGPQPSIAWSVSGAAGDELGADVSLFDGDGDGYADLVAGAPGRGTTGAFKVYRGDPGGLLTQSPVATIVGPVPEYDDFGSHITR